MYANTRNHLELTQEEVSRFLECSADATLVDTRTLPNGWPRHQDWHGAAVTDAAAQASEPGASEPTPVTPTEAGTQCKPPRRPSEPWPTSRRRRRGSSPRSARSGPPERRLVRPVPPGEPPPRGPDAQTSEKRDAPPQETAAAVAAAKTAKTSPSEEYSYTSRRPAPQSRSAHPTGAQAPGRDRAQGAAGQ